MIRRALLIMLMVPAMALASEPTDSAVLSRVFGFREAYATGVEGFSTNVYLKHLYQTHKRNATLWVVPTMYAIAKGQREFVSEQYGRFVFKDIDDYENHRQVYYTTIPHNRHTMPVLLEFLTPDLYDATMYGDHILSPFNRANRIFYRYRTVRLNNWQTRLYFRPRYVNNTQLVSGQAIVNHHTGRIAQVELQGEFDMIRFKTLSMQGDAGPRALLPKLCLTSIDFRFAGNHITSDFEAVFDCPITLPDSVNVKGDRQLIDSVRPVSLSEREEAIYHRFDSIRASADSMRTAWEENDTATTRESKRRRNNIRDIGWDLVGENLIRSLKTQSTNGYVKLSPIINPQYISYSHNKGLAYKFKIGAQYNFSEQVSVNFNPNLGYNFKLKKLYYTTPFRLDYDKERDAHVDLVWGNGNRIANSTVLDQVRREQTGDQLPIDGKDLDLFDDQHLRVTNNIMLTPWMGVETGFIYHERRAVNRQGMQQLGRPTEYKSFAPLVSVRLRPWRKAPLFTIDYERGLKGRRQNLTYERWEADASVKHRMTRMQTLNMRVGGGLYTRRDNNYFMDFSNFRDENLPEGWDDDWSGNFQLLSSRMYNESNYYARGNVSYESPLMAASFIPFAGRYVERERAYLNTLLIAHTRPYTEIGYGFTCRYFSMAFFASFLNVEFQKCGCKFTFELFRRW